MTSPVSLRQLPYQELPSTIEGVMTAIGLLNRLPPEDNSLNHQMIPQLLQEMGLSDSTQPNYAHVIRKIAEMDEALNRPGRKESTLRAKPGADGADGVQIRAPRRASLRQHYNPNRDNRFDRVELWGSSAEKGRDR